MNFKRALTYPRDIMARYTSPIMSFGLLCDRIPVGRNDTNKQHVIKNKNY